ncbi:MULTISPECIES: FHA domain-containing protein [unclassified Polaromonas]|uniref:FHA domain-containing protein n=1 Tax=unclassified Polaromonas TaxID=2638319 RepID=UPI0018C978D5|nr:MULTISPECIES: FHA domain-containing protein [unclassified Polaromonas]MBG6073485.1 pSer/pThr/pTyr-binding forkhead associated (FHA) protein [Polaromonas sp. CG_9.7]MBG6115469.1 pSer/pThr/pTyr-binding forkhead associated (FHA) protein [Polaromonas sp. CG_9.2]MDH6183279.1 pSer/pThr/pTyr-binding forkhead associated (FHA) protein [Polaromonas sp. CG_23.6]
MPKMIIYLDGAVLKEVQLTKDRTSLGRRPYNDIVIDNMAVSGEHAVVQMSGSEVHVEDLNSTNGTYVNGKTVKKQQQLHHGDTVEIGKYKIQYVDEANFGESAINGAIKVISGPAAGRELALVKPVTTIGKAGVGVASISRTSQGFVVTHVEGSSQPMLNGAAVGAQPVALNHGDMIELAGTQMQFVQQ